MTISVESNLLTPAEVATLFRVSPKTVTRWARSGKLTALRTLGGHRRFRASEVKDLLERFEEVASDLA
ncbi:MAG TPA: BldC family transcriptional regulator [Acidimicrobiales bacterium]|nr:BldC family transcriptional regulator [Acidimicrobiales bacterium]